MHTISVETLRGLRGELLEFSDWRAEISRIVNLISQGGRLFGVFFTQEVMMDDCDPVTYDTAIEINAKTARDLENEISKIEEWLEFGYTDDGCCRDWKNLSVYLS